VPSTRSEHESGNEAASETRVSSARFIPRQSRSSKPVRDDLVSPGQISPGRLRFEQEQFEKILNAWNKSGSFEDLAPFQNVMEYKSIDRNRFPLISHKKTSYPELQLHLSKYGAELLQEVDDNLKLLRNNTRIVPVALSKELQEARLGLPIGIAVKVANSEFSDRIDKPGFEYPLERALGDLIANQDNDDGHGHLLFVRPSEGTALTEIYKDIPGFWNARIPLNQEENSLKSKEKAIFQKELSTLIAIYLHGDGNGLNLLDPKLHDHNFDRVKDINKALKTRHQMIRMIDKGSKSENYNEDQAIWDKNTIPMDKPNQNVLQAFMNRHREYRKVVIDGVQNIANKNINFFHGIANTYEIAYKNGFQIDTENVYIGEEHCDFPYLMDVQSKPIVMDLEARKDIVRELKDFVFSGVGDKRYHPDDLLFAGQDFNQYEAATETIHKHLNTAFKIPVR
jgi:hypothetical protein